MKIYRTDKLHVSLIDKNWLRLEKLILVCKYELN
jgi:hypothetical protein